MTGFGRRDVSQTRRKQNMNMRYLQLLRQPLYKCISPWIIELIRGLFKTLNRIVT